MRLQCLLQMQLNQPTNQRNGARNGSFDGSFLNEFGLESQPPWLSRMFLFVRIFVIRLLIKVPPTRFHLFFFVAAASSCFSCEIFVTKVIFAPSFVVTTWVTTTLGKPSSSSLLVGSRSSTLSSLPPELPPRKARELASSSWKKTPRNLAKFGKQQNQEQNYLFPWKQIPKLISEPAPSFFPSKISYSGSEAVVAPPGLGRCGASSQARRQEEEGSRNAPVIRILLRTRRRYWVPLKLLRLWTLSPTRTGAAHLIARYSLFLNNRQHGATSSQAKKKQEAW